MGESKRRRPDRRRKATQPLPPLHRKRPYKPYTRNDANALLIYYLGFWLCLAYLRAQIADDFRDDPKMMEPDIAEPELTQAPKFYRETTDVVERADSRTLEGKDNWRTRTMETTIITN